MPFSRLANPSATLDVLRRHGLTTKKRLGQHLLVDDNVIGRILSLAEPDPADVVLEVGPGIGTLTVALCERARRVVAVERDAELLPVLADLAEECPALRVVHADAVAVPVEDLLTEDGSPTALVANLPYGVAATVVLRIFEEVPSIGSATVMVQAEVADRMAAQPGTKDYGAYTVKLRLLARPTGRFPVSRACFLPPPRVDSAVIRLERSDALDPETRRRAARVANAAFAQRRKTLRNSLAAALPASGAAVDEVLRGLGIDPNRRAETLEPEEFVTLASALHIAGIVR